MFKIFIPLWKKKEKKKKNANKYFVSAPLSNQWIMKNKNMFFYQ